MRKIKIGLLGLGRTGKIVSESFKNDNRFDVVFTVKNKSLNTTYCAYNIQPKEKLPILIEEKNPQIMIDFTNRKATMQNIKHLKRGMGIVIATTGFTSVDFKKLKSMKHLKILYAPNISDGINILMKACMLIAGLWREADIEIIEQHFKGKKEVSGTAKKISNMFNNKVPIHSVRAGGIVGIHKVIFAMPNQKIIIKHESFSKEVFAAAAKKAAIWLNNKKTGYYEISEMYK